MMNGTLSIQGDLLILSELAAKIEAWFPGATSTDVAANGWGGWTTETMEALLLRIHPWQLLLVSFLTSGGGHRLDSEVREKFALGASGLRGQTGAISKHIDAMKKAGIVPNDASYLVRVDRTTHIATFEIPTELLAVVEGALAQATVATALSEARQSQQLDERD